MRDNFIYISTDLIHNMVIARGISSADFVKGLKEIPDNIVLLNDDRKHANGLNAHTKFSTIQGARSVKAYLLDNKIGDKKVIDYQSNEDLDELLDYEIADLLYLSHMGFPMHDAFSSKLHNRYIYMMMKAHFTRGYYRDANDFNTILNVCVKRHMLATIDKHQPVFSRANVLERIRHRSSVLIVNLPKSAVKRLVKLTENGMIIAFDQVQVTKHRHLYRVPLLIEKYPDAQSTWYYKQDIYQNAFRVGTLTYNTADQRKWRLRIKK